jgi:hypothetical protein
MLFLYQLHFFPQYGGLSLSLSFFLSLSPLSLMLPSHSTLYLSLLLSYILFLFKLLIFFYIPLLYSLYVCVYLSLLLSFKSSFTGNF